MKTQSLILLIIITLLSACAQPGSDPVSLDLNSDQSVRENEAGPCYVTWGVYDMVIARDG